MAEMKVLIVEDEPLIAEDIAACLRRRDFTVTSILYSSEDFEEELKKKLPDVVILDINLNGNQEGIELARFINGRYQLPFIYITSYSDRKTLEQAKDTEPAGYIVKPFTEAGLYATLEIAMHNHVQKSRSKYPDLVLNRINNRLKDPISQREFEVLRLIYEGCSNQQISEKLFVSSNTVKAHIRSIYFKLDTASRSGTIARLRELMLQ